MGGERMGRQMVDTHGIRKVMNLNIQHENFDIT